MFSICLANNKFLIFIVFDYVYFYHVCMSFWSIFVRYFFSTRNKTLIRVTYAIFIIHVVPFCFNSTCSISIAFGSYILTSFKLHKTVHRVSYFVGLKLMFCPCLNTMPTLYTANLLFFFSLIVPQLVLPVKGINQYLNYKTSEICRCKNGNKSVFKKNVGINSLY